MNDAHADNSQDGDNPSIEQEEISEAPRQRPPRKRRPVWWSIRAVLLLIATPVVMAVIAFFLMIGQEVSAPSWVVKDVEARTAEVLAGGSMEFGKMTMTIGEDLHPQLVVRNAILRDGDGAVLARVPQIEGLISPRGILQGRVLPQEVRLRGAQISLRRDRDGTVALAFDQGGATVGAADGFVELLDQLDQVFEGGALEALEEVRAEGLIINYVDARAGRSWVVDDGRITLNLRDGRTQLRADVALLSGRSYVSTAELTYASHRGTREAQIGLVITDTAAGDIASQSPLLTFLSVLDAPISGAVRGTIDATGQLAGVSATLQMGAGELRPTAATRPIPFQQARTYLSYDPRDETMVFDLIEIDSDWGRIAGTAQTYLREFDGAWPNTLLGQIQLSEMALSPDELFAEPLQFSDGIMDFRFRFDPFTFDVGQAVIVREDVPVTMRGQALAATDGWAVSLDVAAEEIETEPLLALWPNATAPQTRNWLEQNLSGGVFRDLSLAYRVQPDARPVTSLAAEFFGTQIKFLPTLPPIDGGFGRISIAERRFAVALEGGTVSAPEGGRLDLAGSTMVIPQMGIPNPPTRFDLALQGRVTAAMSILNEPPFNVLRASDLPVSFAQGRADINVALDMPLGQGVTPDQRIWSAVADVRDVRSQSLVPNQTVTAQRLRVEVSPTSLLVQGPARVGDVGGTVTFARALGPGSAGTAQLNAQVTLGPTFLRTFNIDLPPGMVSGDSTAQLAINLADVQSPSFRLSSDLRGTALTLAGLGWSKARNTAGALTVTGQLGQTPRIDQFSLAAPGLQTNGTIRLTPGGGLEQARFERVRLGGWLDAPVTLIGRGQGRPPRVEISSGSLDLRNAEFGGGGGGEGGPIEVALNALQVSDTIRLDDFRGAFTTQGGLQGDFTGALNGQAPIRGTLVPLQGRSAVRIQSDDAGSVMRASGILRTAFGGTMELRLLPSGSEGSFDGTLVASDVRVQDAPALASLLDAISVVGLLNQLGGQGLLFNDVDAQFRLTPTQIIVTQSSAVGPGLGISLDGIYAQSSKTMDFQGVVSPFFLINGIGSVLTRPGEGLIGFNFNLRGPVDNPQVLVNPLSALTPGMFRDIFRRPPPRVGQ